MYYIMKVGTIRVVQREQKRAEESKIVELNDQK